MLMLSDFIGIVGMTSKPVFSNTQHGEYKDMRLSALILVS